MKNEIVSPSQAGNILQVYTTWSTSFLSSGNKSLENG